MIGFATRWARRPGFTAVAVLTVLTSFGPRTAPATAAAQRASGKLVPSSGALVGAWVDPDGRWIDNQSAEGEVTTFEKQIGRKLDLDSHYYAWTDKFPSGLEQWDLQNGRTPIVSWKAADLGSIASGAQDGLIRQRADDLKALGKPVFLRFAWEMNGNWYPWSGAQSSDPGTHNGPAQYVAAWRHIHNVFAAQGANNVVWVWSPNNESVPADPWNAVGNYYPGDKYVDWVGVDGYNWGTSESWSSWTSFTQLFSNFYDKYSSSKPIMVAETATVSAGGSKPGWIDGAATAMKSQFPDIAAFVYFDAPTSWLLAGEPAATQAFTQLAHQRYFDPAGNGSGSGSGSGGGSGSGSNGKANVSLTGVTATPNSLVKSTWISFKIDRPAKITVRIHDSAGNVIRHRLNHASFRAGTRGLRWYGKNDHFKRVPSGRYTAVVVAFDKNGNHVRSTTEIDVV